MNAELEAMTIEELNSRLQQLRENMCDIEDLHSFTFGKTSLHIGAERAQSMQSEFEEECLLYTEQIGAVEKEIRKREHKGA